MKDSREVHGRKRCGPVILRHVPERTWHLSAYLPVLVEGWAHWLIEP